MLKPSPNASILRLRAARSDQAEASPNEQKSPAAEPAAHPKPFPSRLSPLSLLGGPECVDKWRRGGLEGRWLPECGGGFDGSGGAGACPHRWNTTDESCPTPSWDAAASSTAMACLIAAREFCAPTRAQLGGRGNSERAEPRGERRERASSAARGRH